MTSPIKMTPLHNRVLVRRSEKDKVSSGGIVIPDTTGDKPVYGEVIAVGGGKMTEDGEVIKMEVCVGDMILFGKYVGSEILIHGETLLVMCETDILAIVY